MKELPFTKMHGIGNDFVVVDARRAVMPVDPFARAAGAQDLARRLGDRRFGVGADQILLLRDSAAADFRMVIYNADGGEVEMCGNGIRCLARYVWDHGLSTKDVLAVETTAGIIRPERSGTDVAVDMGEPVLEGSLIPVDVAGRVLDHPVTVDGTSYRFTGVSMGNPHAVIFVDDVDEAPVATDGPKIEKHRLFPNRTNVEFVEVLDRTTIRLRVWERGAGETLACGTGACAAAVAAVLHDQTERDVKVRLRGGDLTIHWRSSDNRVIMTGPAETVFTGRFRMGA